jgi:hypothetical protein
MGAVFVSGKLAVVARGDRRPSPPLSDAGTGERTGENTEL